MGEYEQQSQQAGPGQPQPPSQQAGPGQPQPPRQQAGPGQPQPPRQQPNQQHVQTPREMGYQPMTVGEWMLTLFILSIPIVGIVMLFVWGFGDDVRRKNFARAYLIWIAIFVGIVILFYLVIFVIIMSTAGLSN